MIVLAVQVAVLRPRSSSVCAGGDEGNRTPNPRLAKAVLCQLSYVPAAREEPLSQVG
jgi:hypothetical protein